MSVPVIRKARFTDIEFILEIEHESAGTWTYNQFFQELKNEFSLFIVAETEHSVIGYLVAWRVADEIQLNNIAVRKDSRQQGIGSRLLSEICTADNNNKFSSIFLEVRSRNIEAINFYSANGFTKSGIRKNYYNDDDAILMEKKL